MIAAKTTTPSVTRVSSRPGAMRYTITAMNVRQQITAATYGTSLNGTWCYDSNGFFTYTKAQIRIRQDYPYVFDADTGNLNSPAITLTIFIIGQKDFCRFMQNLLE